MNNLNPLLIGVILIIILVANTAVYSENGAGGPGTKDFSTNITAFCSIENFTSLSNIPIVLGITHNITNTNIVLIKDDIIKVRITMNTNIAAPLFGIGNIALDLPTEFSNQLSNNFIYTGSYIIKEGDYQLHTPVIGYISYLGYESYATALKKVNIDAKKLPELPSITSINHTSDPDTQFTPDTLIEIIMNIGDSTTVEDAYFSIAGMTNVSFIEMTEINKTKYRGIYKVKSTDFIKNGTLRGIIVGDDSGVTKTNYYNQANIINIGTIIEKKDNNKRRIVVQSIDVEGKELNEKDTTIVFPKGTLAEDVKIRIKPLSLLSFKYQINDASDSVIFKIPKQAQINMRYLIKDNKIEGLNIPSNAAKGNIALYYFDIAGKWQKISENVNTEKQVVYASVNRPGIYSIRENQVIDGVIVAPNPFTPGNNDGVNDTVFIYVNNFNNKEVKAFIFTLEGYKICDIKKEKITDNGTVTLIEWDGKKENKVVDGGLYILKIKVGETWYTATVALAK